MNQILFLSLDIFKLINQTTKKEKIIMAPILSIAIPTYNRSIYMIKCLTSILSIDGNMEIVISDSSNDMKLKAFLENEYNYFLQDSRLRYYYTEEALDMTSNLNRAINFCTGDYVVFLGDDDTLVPEILQYIEKFKEMKVGLISPDIVVNYAWPDFSTKYFKNGHKCNLYIDYNEPYIKKISTSIAFYEAISKCFQGTDGLPKLYHGFVSRELLYSIKNKTGEFLHGSTPDMSAAIGLCFVADHFVRCNFPLTIPGASGMSNTGRVANKKHVGNLKDESQTAGISNEAWIIGIPRYFSVETVWAQAGIETSLKFNNLILKNFPFEKLIAICLVIHPSRFKINISSLNEFRKKMKKNFYFEILKFILKFSSYKIIKFVKRCMNPTASNGRHHIKSVLDIYQAQLAYKNRIDKVKNFDIEGNLKLIEKFRGTYEY